MYSPAINDEWVAIKEFPFLTAERYTNQSSASQLSNSSSTTSKQNKDWKFTVKWIDDLNIIQLKCQDPNIYDPQSLEQEQSNENVDECCSPSNIYISEFSVEKFASIHQQMSLICPSIGNSLPDLPQLPKGIWSFVSAVQVPTNLEKNLVDYLEIVFYAIGEKIFLESFYQQGTVTEEEYLENLDALNRKSFTDNVTETRNLLSEVLALRNGSINIHDMVCLYDLEDEAQEKVDLAEAILYNFDRQPFLDMREIAHQQLSHENRRLLDLKTSEEEKTSIAEKCLYWETQKDENDANLLDLQISFLENLLVYLINCRDRMINDKERFGESFVRFTGNTRLQEKEKEIAKLSLQIFLLKRNKLITQREKIAKQVTTLDENDQLEKEIAKIEKNFFEMQMKIYVLDLKIIGEQEKFYRMKLKELKGDEKDGNENENDLFVDAFEEQPGEFDETVMTLNSSPTEEMKVKRERKEIIQKLNQLFRKRAMLRNKQRKCELDRKIKIGAKKEAEDNYKLHHSIQLRRDQNRKQLEEKAEFIQNSRKKTIERLKSFKKKYPDIVVKRPPRYLPPVRRTRNGSNSSMMSLQQQQNKQSKVTNMKIPTVDRSTNESHQDCQANSKEENEKLHQANAEASDSSTLLPSIPLPPPPLPPPLLPPPPPKVSIPIPPPPPILPLMQESLLGNKFVAKDVKLERRGVNEETNQMKDDTKSMAKNRIVDLNQIITARQNLRKNVYCDVNTDVNQDLISMIKRGVTLKKVDRATIEKEKSLSDIAASMLRITLAKMNKHMADSSDEEEDAEEFL